MTKRLAGWISYKRISQYQSTKKFTRKCFNSDQIGHKAENCLKKHDLTQLMENPDENQREQECILMVKGKSKGNIGKFDELTSIHGCVIQLECAI